MTLIFSKYARSLTLETWRLPPSSQGKRLMDRCTDSLNEQLSKRSSKESEKGYCRQRTHMIFPILTKLRATLAKTRSRPKIDT